MNKLYICRRFKHKFGLYNKRKSALNGFILHILICIILVSALLIGGISRIGSLAVSLGASRLGNDISSECSKIAARLLEENNITYNDIISQKINTGGEITSMSTDFTRVNFLKSSVSQELSEYMNSLRKVKIGVPIGAVFSNDIITGWGFNIPAYIAVSGTAFVEFCDDFVSAGVNQSKHRLMLRISVNARIYGAFCSDEQNEICDIPLAETIIVGDASGILLQKSIDN